MEPHTCTIPQGELSLHLFNITLTKDCPLPINILHYCIQCQRMMNLKGKGELSSAYFVYSSISTSTQNGLTILYFPTWKSPALVS